MYRDYTVTLNYWLIDWLIVLSIDWLIDWLFCRSINWLIDQLIDWLIDWLFCWLLNWLIDRLFCRLIDLLIDWWFGRLIDWSWNINVKIASNLLFETKLLNYSWNSHCPGLLLEIKFKWHQFELNQKNNFCNRNISEIKLHYSKNFKKNFFKFFL